MKIFHHNDNDGKAAASVLYNYFKIKGYELAEDNFISINYNNSIPSTDLIEENDTVFIVDYSFTNNTVNILYDISKKVNGNVYWYDHHKTSLDVLDKVIEDQICKNVIIDMNRSGARIVYDEYFGLLSIGYMDKIIDLVDDHDRWIHNYPESILFNIGSSMEDNSPMSDIWTSNPSKIIENGRIIKQYNDIVNLRITKRNSYIIDINGYECIVLNTPIASSQAFSEYYHDYNFAIRYSFNGNNYNYSVYSSLDDIDCAEIAKYFNPKGGGHKGAAGFTSDKLLFKDGDKFTIEF